jgi:hypothetical protein
VAIPTSSTARPNAGRTIPVRPRLRWELRDSPVVLPVALPVELRHPVVELSDSVVAPVDAGFVDFSIAARCRDNAVPSVCVAPYLRHLLLAINAARKEVHPRATLQENCRKVYLAFSDANHSLITRSVTEAAELRDDQRHE